MAPPPSHLRLQAPPFRLLLGALWRIARQQTSEHFGVLEEFVSMVTEAVPELLSVKERTVLMLALRAKVYLSDPDPVHLDRRKVSTVIDSEWNRSMSSLKDAVSKGLNPELLQEVFGREFDSALQSLLCHFLSHLQQLLPVPDFTQITAMLDDDWTEKCLQEAKCSELKQLLTNHNAVPTPVRTGLESRSELVLKSTWEQLLQLNKTTNQQPDQFKLTNHEPAVSKPIITVCKPASKTLILLRTTNNNPAVPHPIITFAKTTNQKPSLSKPTNQKLILLKPTNQKSAGLKLTNQKPVSILTNQGPEVLKPTNMVLLLPANPKSASLKPTNQKQALSSTSQQPPKSTPPNQESVLLKPIKSEPVYEEEIVIGQELLDDSPLDQPQPTLTTATTDQSQPRAAAIDQSETAEAVAAIDQSEPCTAAATEKSAAAPTESDSQNPRRLAHKCPQCGRCFLYRNQVLKHLRANHACGSALQQIGALHCFQCGQVFESSPDLLSHQRTHWSSYPPLNKTAKKKTFRKNVLQENEKTKKLQQRPFTCTLCPEVFRYQSRLLTHLEEHALKGEEPQYNCLYCDQHFKISTQLRIHQRSHLDRRYTCAVCGKGFGSESALDSHKQLHGEKTYLCHTCGKSFLTKERLKSHSITHTEERPYQCTFCNKTYKYNAGLREHLRRHLGEKPYICSVCGKSWVSGGDLQYHMRIHTGEKPHICLTCGKRFTMSTHLSSHRLLHTGEKPFPCPECGKNFRRKTCLQKHLRVHYNDRPFKCHLCPKAYTCKKYLKRHLLTHKDKDQDCTRTRPRLGLDQD